MNPQQPPGPPGQYGPPQGYGQQPQGYPGYQPGYSGHGGQPPPSQKGTSGCIVALAVVGGITVLVVGAGVLIAMSSGRPATGASGPGGPGGPGGLLGKLRSPQVVVDEEVAVGASGWQTRGFSLPDARPVQVMAEGRSNADKGFMVYVMDTVNCAKFSKGQSAQHFASFEGLKIRSFTHTDTLPAGSYCAAVQNSENIFNTMVVHLRVVVDPS